MANLRVLDINAADSRTIKVRFSSPVTEYVSASNVLVVSKESGIPDAEVIGVSTTDDILIIETQPMTPFSRYDVIFRSTNAVKFTSVDGQSYLVEDGQANVRQVLGSEDPDNQIRDYLAMAIGGMEGVYDISRESLVRTILNMLSDEIRKAKADIRESKSAVFLRRFVKDEQKVRGFGPWDRLNQEGAYSVVRVGLQPTDTTIPGSIPFSYFPHDPVTLQRVVISKETLSAGFGSGTFDGLLLTVENSPVTKLKSVSIQYENGDVYNYNISSYGYRINNTRYDSQFSRTLVTLEDNQFQLSDDLLDDATFVLPGGNDKIVVSYEYKNLGINVDEQSVTVTQVIPVVREPAPALSTVFSLIGGPVVTAGDQIPTSGGVVFLDPYSATPFRNIHPAFLRELPYRQEGLPKQPGEYCVDYSTGRVYVYGASSNDGTGYFPPAMTYNYRKSYVSKLDYTYVPEYMDLVASPLRELIGQPAKINFNLQVSLVPGKDYVANVHEESRNERIGNKIASLGSVYTSHSPITNVFRVYNETSGEVYTINRFNKNRIYYSYRTPPNIQDAIRERATFAQVLNEQLVLDSETINGLGTRIFKFVLRNSVVISATDDSIGSNYNTSATFSRPDIFGTELYYDGQELPVSTNINRITVGDYQINYRTGEVYVGVPNSQEANVGSITYKKKVIAPNNPHVISVSDVYYSIAQNTGITKKLDFTSFDDGEITPSVVDPSDERFTNNDTSAPYFFYNGTITVTDDIKTVRGVYDAYDLNNNRSPVNFADSASWDANVITLSATGINQTATVVVGPGLVISTPFISPGMNVSLAISAIRASDNQQLIDGYETISGNDITLSVTSGAVVGDVVNVIYTIVLNGASTPVVDYNKGDYFVDYSYLLDEILVTYEWGDNVIDFRTSKALDENDEYYVSYIVGALRDDLLKNFGSMVQIDELQAFDEDMDREIYRAALSGALQTFTQGPTLPAMKQLVAFITKIEPEIVEALFNAWTLGTSYLGKVEPSVLGAPEFVSAVFDQGLLANKKQDAVAFPISNNLRLEEGTIQMFVIPEWNGLDNDAALTFELFKDGYNMVSRDIYIGATGYNPTIVDGKFTVSRLDEPSPIGIPATIYTNKGMFIYYDIDVSQWKVLAKDIPAITDGYMYSGTITSDGSFYNAKNIPGLGEPSDVIRSGIKTIDFELHLDGYDVAGPDGYNGLPDGYVPGYSFDGIQFMSDRDHYLFDFGRSEFENRFSLYKDGRGYLVFEVWDKGGTPYSSAPPRRKNVYQVSADISSWKVGEKHNVAASWILNSVDKRDEMHLFVDGFETPNVARYGNIPSIASSNRFRTVVPEQVVGTVTKTSIAGNDLKTTAGLQTVTSATQNFSASGIVPGDTIQINEQGFGTYTIVFVNGNELTLTSSMPASLDDARFSVNPATFIVSTEVDIYKNIAVFVSSGGVETEIPGQSASIPSYSIGRNANNQRILTILGNVSVGDTVLLKTFGLNHRRSRDKLYLWSDGESILKTQLPPPINLDDVIIKAVPLTLTPIGPANSTLILGDFQASLTGIGQPTNSTTGRHLEIRITGDNTNFTNPVTVTINGTSSAGPSEIVTFTQPGKKSTVANWKTITSVDVVVTPSITTKDATGVEIKELYSVTVPDGSTNVPVIRYAYRTQSGSALEGVGGGSPIVSDTMGAFYDSDIGNLLEITSPPSVAGIYTIADRLDSNTIRIDTGLTTAFSNGTYGVYNISIGRSGFQNGFFFLEKKNVTNQPYGLPKGWYEIDYATYLAVPMDPIDNINAFVGNDMTGNKPSNAIIDELRILNMQLTDTRVGETIGENEDSITVDASAFSPFVKTKDTLTLLHFDENPPINDVDFYRFATKEYIQSGTSVNDRFGKSIVVKDKGLVFDNEGKLSTNKEGMIEFWVNPRFDTFNDPNVRVYFDASANAVETVTSITKGRVMVNGRVSRVVSVKLASDPKSSDDYFAGGTIDTDRKTLILNRPLPYQQTPVIVSYVPSGSAGDRIVIAKDSDGGITFTVWASGKEYQVRQMVFWPRDTWHRIRASFKFNRPDHNDEIRLFVDGEERGTILFGTNLVFGPESIFGQAPVGAGSSLIDDINFTDTVTQFSLGQDFTGAYGAQARFDNLKISNKSINPLVVGGQSKDVYYNINKDFIYPSIEDAFTTFLFDFDQLVEKVTDFAILRDPTVGIFNFDLNIIDSFGIVLGDAKVKKVLEAMIAALKPAVSKANITYVK
jgi:hypothetical protein